MNRCVLGMGGGRISMSKEVGAFVFFRHLDERGGQIDTQAVGLMLFFFFVAQSGGS